MQSPCATLFPGHHRVLIAWTAPTSTAGVVIRLVQTMRKRSVCWRLAPYVILALALLTPVSGSKAQPLPNNVKARIGQMIGAWQNARGAPPGQPRIKLIERSLNLALSFRRWPLKQPGRDDLLAQMWGQLANEYMRLPASQNADAPDRAIAAYGQALRHSQATGEQAAWAKAQRGIGIAYLERRGGDRADNVEKAIAALNNAMKFFARTKAPDMWGSLQVARSKALWHRVKGSRDENLEQAIAAAKAALGVFSRERSASDWRAAQSALGAAYWARLRGSRADNVEAAIAAYEQALAVTNRERKPAVWAGLHDNLGMAYGERIRGERGENIEKSIAAFKQAGEVYTRKNYPADWAQLQMNLGIALLERKVGGRSANAETAIEAFNRALTVYTPKRFPEKWARTMTNLGNAYSTGPTGRSADNTERAIEAYQNALRVYTRRSAPAKWAAAQSNLGAALFRRSNGQRAQNLRSAATALDAALSVYTFDAFPWEHLKAARRAGTVAAERGDWRTAAARYNSAVEASQRLFARGLNTAEATALIDEGGQLFLEAAYAAIERNNLPRALDLLEAGKGRLLRIALGLNALALSQSDRKRLDQLRADIRNVERRVQMTTGAERLATLDRLGTLYRSIAAIADNAGAQAPGSRILRGVAVAERLLAHYGAIATPVITDHGARLLLVTPGSGRPSISVVELPRRMLADLNRLIFGPEDAGRTGGWLGAYRINELPAAEHRARASEWYAAIRDVGPLLWSGFVGKLAEALDAARVPRDASVVWIPQGALGVLPIGLATDTTSGETLLDRYTIILAPNLAAVEAGRRRTADMRGPATLAAVVNPTGDLVYAAAEGVAAASHFPATSRTVLDGSSATATNVVGVLKKSRYWHFATHGMFSWDSPGKSALLLARKERLTLGDLLHHGGLGHPRLVVLSACETGHYDYGKRRDEFVGFPAAFLENGAAGVVGTLWPVDDVSTALTMMKFYELHLGGRLEPAAALRRTQIWLRDASRETLLKFVTNARRSGRLSSDHEKMFKDAIGTRKSQHPFRHPVFWAAFQFFGA